MQVEEKGQSQMHEIQHPLAVDECLKTDEKSYNSRRRRRGSRRRSSANTAAPAAPEATTVESVPPTHVQEEEQQHHVAQPSAESDPFFMTVHQNNGKHRRRSSHTGRRRKSSAPGVDKDKSPALQSLVDIISEMKRLPSISVTPDDPAEEAADEVKDQDAWRRVRRHSAPFRKSAQTSTHGTLSKTAVQEQHQKPMFLNSFNALEEETPENDSNNKESVSPLHNDKEHLMPAKRTRSKSVPNTLASPSAPQHHQQQEHGSARKVLFPTHLSVSEASAAVRARKLYSGVLKVDMQDSSEANVECEDLDASIYIFGSRNRNRALDGDEVAVELVSVDEMLNEKAFKKQARYTRRLSTLSLNSPSSLASNGGLSSITEDISEFLNDDTMKERPKYCGKVVSILERPKNRSFSGTLSLHRPYAKLLDNASRDKKDTHPPKIIWFVPGDKRLPLVAVPIKFAPADFIKYHEEYKNRIFVGTIQRWTASSLHPFGTIEKEIGWMGELSVHSGALMADHHVKDASFTESVLKEVESLPKGITKEDRKGRRDLSQEDIKIFTMGSTDGKGVENAFSVNLTEEGVYEIGVHVPDVAKYVWEGTGLDREARERSCTVELVDKKINIFPSSFIESHCNLEIGEERQAYSVLCRFTENGILLHAWIGKTIIKPSHHVKDSELTQDAKTILKICQKLQHNRLHKQGGLSLARSIQTFSLGDSGYPSNIDLIAQTDRDVLLQELLILVNTEVGQKISSRFPDQALLLRQSAVNMSKLTPIQDYFDNDPSTNTVDGLWRLIKEKESSVEKQEALRHIVRQAIPNEKYYSAGSVDISKFRHCAFGASIYAAFTQPIHNYASVHIQRQLSAALQGKEQGDGSFDMIDKIARRCNSSQLSKIAAEKDSRKLYTAAYIYSQCLAEEAKSIAVEAFVIGLASDAIQLYIPEYDMELSMPLNEKTLMGGYHAYQADLDQVRITWLEEEDDSNESHQVLKFMSSIYVDIHIEMKNVRPIIDVTMQRQ